LLTDGEWLIHFAVCRNVVAQFRKVLAFRPVMRRKTDTSHWMIVPTTGHRPACFLEFHHGHLVTKGL
jgi:hypothetical protein